ncbi:glutathione-regulated potassium-efflux system oxidoreductase KefF [Herbaspirillum autotrophicum]|uniref:glutathione-regulated potassium-efflux system oxidoreductase KefF n=1 Tax=Herbaspirillum autotrophicum TaxID=180195 RepID=UPI00067D5825|nr:NAD(P)H-dependent oxidoreductase [Herbaspirillum autotrophicum]
MTSPCILILYAHPAANRSRANRRLIAAVADLPQVRIHDLYEMYPDFHIDIAYEQTQLQQADLVILQHPIHWYSMPSLQKEWIDMVLQRGWAFGPGGNALQGKDFLLVATTGGGADAYQEQGHHGHPFADFLPPYEQTARLCGMRWLPPLLLHGAHHVSDDELKQHVAHYRAMLQAYPHSPLAPAILSR